MGRIGAVAIFIMHASMSVSHAQKKVYLLFLSPTNQSAQRRLRFFVDPSL